MSSRTFLDTNVLVYADDLDAGEKRVTAREILARCLVDRTGVVSTQVLQEFFVVSTRKLGVDPEVARRKVELISTLDVVTIGPAMVVEAIDCHRLHRVSFWDALVIRAAINAGCSRLLTEDLNDGQVIDGVRVEDPFG